MLADQNQKEGAYFKTKEHETQLADLPTTRRAQKSVTSVLFSLIHSTQHTNMFTGAFK